MKYKIVIAEPSHELYVARHMREGDRMECNSIGMSPIEAIRYSVKQSHDVWAWLVDGIPAAIGGIIFESPLGGVSRAWILTTDLVDEHKYAFARMTLRMKGAVEQVTPYLYGYVHVDYSEALKWAGWLGMRMMGPVPVGPHGALYNRIEA